MADIARLEEVKMTSQWPEEENFSRWLSENIDYIENIVGFKIDNIELKKNLEVIMQIYTVLI